MDAHAVWLSQTELREALEATHHGASDWHAAVPRSLAEAYFGRWRLLVAGRAPMKLEQHAEEFLGSVLRLTGARLGRFAAVASLERCDRWACSWRSWLQPGNGSRWRYPEELEEIGPRAAALRSGELTWAPPDDDLAHDWPWGVERSLELLR